MVSLIVGISCSVCASTIMETVLGWNSPSPPSKRGHCAVRLLATNAAGSYLRMRVVKELVNETTGNGLAFFRCPHHSILIPFLLAGLIVPCPPSPLSSDMTGNPSHI